MCVCVCVCVCVCACVYVRLCGWGDLPANSHILRGLLQLFMSQPCMHMYIALCWHGSRVLFISQLSLFIALHGYMLTAIAAAFA